jgi:hypothetical protein
MTMERNSLGSAEGGNFLFIRTNISFSKRTALLKITQLGNYLISHRHREIFQLVNGAFQLQILLTTVLVSKNSLINYPLHPDLKKNWNLPTNFNKSQP